jgi:hypothetical protein
MSAETSGPGMRPPSRRRVLLAVLAGLVAFVAVAVAVGLLAASDDDGATTATSGAPAGVDGGVASPAVPARIVTTAELEEIARESGGPVYWAGEQPGARIEYTRTADGSTYVRYLTGSAQAGSPSGDFVVVATYAQPNAYERVSGVARRTHLTIRTIPDGGIAVSRPGRPQNVYVAYPGQPYQVEVYSPSEATTNGLVLDGRVRPIG